MAEIKALTLPGELEDYRQLVRNRLQDERYFHTLGVAKLAGELAEAYHADRMSALTAALLHDVTKQVPLDIQLQTIKNSGILNDEILLESTNIYHSVTGFLFARDQLGITDVDILNAIRYHTTGRAGMSILEKIIYTSDATSYEREYPEAGRLRALAFENIDRCIYEILMFTIEKLMKRHILIAPDTFYCYNDICRKAGK